METSSEQSTGLKQSDLSFETWEAKLKSEAFKWKKEVGCKLGHAYEQIAKSLGYNTYAAYRADMKDKLK